MPDLLCLMLLAAQVVVSHNELAGKRLKDVRFRQTYGAAVLGIHRQGRGEHCGATAVMPSRTVLASGAASGTT